MKEQDTTKTLPDATPARIPREWQDLYRRLLSLHERLLDDRRELVRDSKYAVGADGTHMADKATDEFERDLDLSLLSAEQDALFEVEEALHRIERGTYGTCELTGKPIPKARLRAIPWTRFTAEAELELEVKGSAGRPHLGELGRVETEPEALSRSLEEIVPPDRSVSPAGLAGLEQETTRAAEQQARETPPETNNDGEFDEQP